MRYIYYWYLFAQDMESKTTGAEKAMWIVAKNNLKVRLIKALGGNWETIITEKIADGIKSTNIILPPGPPVPNTLKGIKKGETVVVTSGSAISYIGRISSFTNDNTAFVININSKKITEEIIGNVQKMNADGSYV